MIRIASVVVALFFVLYPAFSKGEEPLVIGAVEYPPCEYLVEGRSTGINVDVVTEALRRMGREVRFIFVPWQRALLMAQAGKTDAVLDASFSKERETYLRFPLQPLIPYKDVGFIRKGSSVVLTPELNDVSDYSIGITRGYHYEGNLGQALAERRFKRIVQAQDDETGLRMLAAGRFDLFAGNLLPIMFLRDSVGLAKDIAPAPCADGSPACELVSHSCYLAFSKSRIEDEFVEQFSDVLQGMHKDGTFDMIVDKYTMLELVWPENDR